MYQTRSQQSKMVMNLMLQEKYTCAHTYSVKVDDTREVENLLFIKESCKHVVLMSDNYIW